MLTVIAGPGMRSLSGLNLLHSQASGRVQQQTDLQEQCTPDTMDLLLLVYRIRRARMPKPGSSPGTAAWTQ